jgi:cathepsin E
MLIFFHRLTQIPDSLLDTLLVDTGSSNTWIGAGQPYVKTGSSVPTSDSVVSITRSSSSILN